MNLVKELNLDTENIFKDSKELMERKLPKIYDISIDLIDDFPDHPFKVRMDDDMYKLVESIREQGQITPMSSFATFSSVESSTRTNPDAR